ncbi:hypothetical protein [Shewanella subflava]|uniref:Uncharacterized protein n=1 Tax=Shewanella subflava TaxID=2986476 RepID=A0ABT3I5Y1_9GAMM|nr:hypothetical protein [Shewanella subflava]MCW3171418.1 hypothetical protein [Shewanella subflava]
MFKIDISYTRKTENTELVVKANYESSEKQDDQSPKGWKGLVLDYLPLAVNLFTGIASFFLDVLSKYL